MASYRTILKVILVGCLVIGGSVLVVAAADSAGDSKRPSVEGQVMRLDADSVEILIPQAAVSSVAFDFQNPSETSDILTLREGHLVLKGRIVEAAAETLLVRFPKEALMKIVVVYPQPTTPGATSAVKAAPEPVAPSAGEPFEFASAAGYTGDEALTALSPLPGLGPRQETSLEQQVETALDSRLYGRVAGAVVWEGRPLERCEVKLKPLAEEWALLGLFNSFTKRDENSRVERETLTAVTDAQGQFAFPRVPPGPYDLYWRTPGSLSWIRRLSAEPSLTLTPGRTIAYPVIEAHVRTVN
ncbi:MAG: carboxypeptidase regulatory-like domain-containing protein [Nitrospinae bacterium]|nr:carboxypeptidase regulatory-like domain-containing protein [Nitrospinota bacterium]